MNRTKRARLLVGVAFLAAALAAPQAVMAAPRKLRIDVDHSSVTFRVRHLFSKVTGKFSKFSGEIVFDEASPAQSTVSATIEAASIDTNVTARDEDLRSKRFFDVTRFPALVFETVRVDSASGNAARITGKLTMHGVTRVVTLEAEFAGKGKDPWGNERFGFHAQTTVNRKDFGMTWNEVVEAGGVLVGDDVEVVLDIEAVPAS